MTDTPASPMGRSLGAPAAELHRLLVVGLVFTLARPCGAQVSGTQRDTTLLRRLLKDVPQLALEPVELAVHPPLTFDRISALTTDAHGNIYIIHRPSNGDPIVEVDPRGNVVRSWGKGLFRTPHGIRIDPAGNVWAVDAHSSTIYKFTAEGKELLKISVGNVPDTTRAFCGATDIAFASSGHVFVSDGYCNARVIEYDAAGNKLREWGAHGTGPGEFTVVHSIAMSPRGILYVADRENGRIEWFNQDGRFLGQWHYGGRLYAVAFGPAGDLYGSVVARGATASSPDNAFNVIKIDLASGRILGKFAARAHELAVAPDGTLLPASLSDQLILLRPRN